MKRIKTALLLASILFYAILLCTIVIHGAPSGADAAEFLRGDCDSDGFVGGSVNDPVFYLNWAFAGGPAPGCLVACDADGDGFVGGSVNDAVYYLSWAFLGGTPPAAPFPDCGPGTAQDEAVGCAVPVGTCGPGEEPGSSIPDDFVPLGDNEQGYAEYRQVGSGIVFVLVPGGTFQMGGFDSDEEFPPHEVRLRPFLIAKNEVSNGEWANVMEPGVILPPGERRRPKGDVSWNSAKDYVAAIGCTLPSEAQWEYACRAGSTEDFGGNDRLADMGWFAGNSSGEPQAVGQKAPNDFGLHDMHGNVAEWCEDVWNPAYYDRLEAAGPDPIATEGEEWEFLGSPIWQRVVRGGAYSSTPSGCRSASRRGETTRAPRPTQGLRPVRPLPPEIEGFQFRQFNRQALPEYFHEDTGIEFVRLPGGSYSMGSPESEDGSFDDERPRHAVTLSSFLIGKYEVTQAEWRRVVGTSPSHHSGDSRPVEQVSWDDIQEFEAFSGLRLPSEAQWEYACRAGTTGAYSGTGDLGAMGWYYGNSGGSTHVVGQKAANGFGLHDVHGNVREWCESWYASYSNPRASGTRVIRGGGWLDVARYCRSAARDDFDPSFALRTRGFRPAVPLP